MNLETMINNVLPEGSVLYKHNHGAFDFYICDSDFDDGTPFSEQRVDEGFADFINRTIGLLIKKEEGTDNPSTAIDFAINLTKS